MKHNFTCTDGNIILRPLSRSDSEQYRLLRNQENNRHCFIFSDPISSEAQKNWYENYLLEKGDYMFAIYSQDDHFLGGAALYHFSTNSAEFGRIVIDEKYAGKGVGYRALSLLCQLAKEQMGLSMLHLEVFADNQPAKRLYEKAGFLLKRKYPSPKPSQELLYMEKLL